MKLIKLIVITFLLNNPAFADDATSYRDVAQYISANWSTLTRDITKCATFHDQKSTGKSILYFPAEVKVPIVFKQLETNCHIQIQFLPNNLINQVKRDKVHYPKGLLYLPNPYVVPGGMFNEMYGWDSYFIIRGLVEDNKLSLAKGMVENFFFEINHYGSILNANRVYYLSRSQPPFLTSMILSVYDAMKSKADNDLAWLEKAYDYAVRDYQYWTHAPRLAGNTGLSRYYDYHSGPVPEMESFYFRDAIKYFLKHPQYAKNYLVRAGDAELTGKVVSQQLCVDGKTVSASNCTPVNIVGLSKKYYRDDRALRESGLDITFRFGPYGAGTSDYAPVDLNLLLYKTEIDLAKISLMLGKSAEANVWNRLALKRKKKINYYFWNKADGLFYDYNFKTKQQSRYKYVSTFYPLWVGLANAEQARALKNNLKLFEAKGGLVTSTFESGAQWDYPYGWAPFHLITVEGLLHYGYKEDASRIAKNFLSTIALNFYRDGTIREKYNVVTASANMVLKVGYPSNEIGFGWTNGVFLTLQHALSSVKLPAK